MAMGAANGTDVSGFGFTPGSVNETVVDGSFSTKPTTAIVDKTVTQTSVTLYSPDGLIVKILNLPEQEMEYNNLIAQGYVTTKPTVPQKSGGSRSGGSGGTPGGSSPIVDKDWGEGVDWTKPGEYADKIYDSVKNLDNMAGAGFAGASLLGAPAIGIALGVGAKFKVGAAVSDLHAAAIIAEARGLPDEVKRINDMADSLIKSGGGLLQFANYLGMMSGDEKGKNRLDELGYQYGKDDDGSPIFNSTQTKYNSNLGSTPTPEPEDAKKPKGIRSVRGKAKSNKAAEIANKSGLGNPENVSTAIDYNKPPPNKGMTDAEQRISYGAGRANSGSSSTPPPAVNTGGGPRAEGGLMLKKKKKTKGK